jgi:hypothetical protein
MAASPAASAAVTRLSINIEIMFNTGRGNPPMAAADRIRAVAANGSSLQLLERFAGAAEGHDPGAAATGSSASACGTGNAAARPVHKPALRMPARKSRSASRLRRSIGTQPTDLVCRTSSLTFLGDAANRQIVDGLKRAGDIAAAAGVTTRRAAQRQSETSRAAPRSMCRGLPVIKE